MKTNTVKVRLACSMVGNGRAYEVGEWYDATPEEAERLFEHGVIDFIGETADCMALAGGETAMLDRPKRGRPRKVRAAEV